LTNGGVFRPGCSIIAVGRDISVVFVEHFSGKTVDLVTAGISQCYLLPGRGDIPALTQPKLVLD